MFSGLALKSRRAKDSTEIEVLQLPTDRGMSPSDRKARSEGRFLAVQSDGFLDPAVIEKDSPVTVVGEVKGATTKPLDEGEYQYPVLDIKQLVDWNEVRTQERDTYYDSPYAGRYGGYYGPWSSWYYGFGSPFAGPYGFYPYSYYGPYYGPYYGFPRGYSVPAPAPPPPSSIPPQFRKD
jgi:outer membrane lipoprotein